MNDSDHDILRVSEPAAKHSNAGYGYSWHYAGRWYPYDPTNPGALREYRSEWFFGPVLAGVFWILLAGGLGWYNDHLSEGMCLGLFVGVVYFFLAIFTLRRPPGVAEDWSTPDK